MLDPNTPSAPSIDHKDDLAWDKISATAIVFLQTLIPPIKKKLEGYQSNS